MKKRIAYNSQALKIRQEFQAQRSFRLNANILDDLYRGRIKKPEIIQATALRSVLRLVEDQVQAFRLMMAAARFA